MQEYREKKMDKKMAKKPIDQNYFHETNKYTNGSHGYLSLVFVFVLFPAEMWPKQENQKTGQKVCSTL